MRNKINEINIRESATQLPADHENIIENQSINTQDQHESQNAITTTAHHYTDKCDIKSSKMGAVEDWFGIEVDSELEMFDIDISDFQWPESDS